VEKIKLTYLHPFCFSATNILWKPRSLPVPADVPGVQLRAQQCSFRVCTVPVKTVQLEPPAGLFRPGDCTAAAATGVPALAFLLPASAGQANATPEAHAVCSSCGAAAAQLLPHATQGAIGAVRGEFHRSEQPVAL
jgi:hypothetical protein